jgi:hypothetical protein
MAIAHVPIGDNTMKVTLVILFIACASLAFGQTSYGGSALSAQPQVIQFATHPQTATQQSLGAEQSLYVSSNFSWAQGERPLWEVAPPTNVTPLGDIAREFRSEHAKARKSEKVWEN